MEDQRIIGLYWERNPQAIDETQEKYGERLQRMAENLLEIREDAEECVNDTYLGAWNTMPPKRPSLLFAYLARICRNAVCNRIDWLQAKKRNAQIVELSAEMELCLPSPDEERRQSSQEVGQALSDFLKRQKPQVRKIFLRRYWFGDSIREIAGSFGIGESKVKTTLFRTRNLLREYLQKEGIDL